jgi:hypothetical protein
MENFNFAAFMPVESLQPCYILGLLRRTTRISRISVNTRPKYGLIWERGYAVRWISHCVRVYNPSTCSFFIAMLKLIFPSLIWLHNLLDELQRCS